MSVHLNPAHSAAHHKQPSILQSMSAEECPNVFLAGLQWKRDGPAPRSAGPPVPPPPPPPLHCPCPCLGTVGPAV